MKQLKNSFLAAAVVLLLLARPAQAAQEGSLQVRDVDAPVTLYTVADASGVLTEEFAGGPVQGLNGQTALADAAQTLSQYALDKAITGQTRSPDEQKQVLFAPLDICWYLVCSNAEEKEFAPFLVQIPTEVSGKVIYHIQATPKEDAIPEPTQPETPSQPGANLPQTGFIQWPKYLLLALGGGLIFMGTFTVIRGREKRHD